MKRPHPQFIVFFILISATLLRIAAAVLHIDLIHPDEHFQVLEPANLIVNGFGLKSWEWYHGTRSWGVPALYMPVLYALKVSGITAGYISVAVCRAFTAILGGWMLWRFKRLLEDSKLAYWTVVIVFAALAFSPNMIVWSGSTFSDTWALLILWIVMPSLCDCLVNCQTRWSWIGAGALLGLTFLARVQMLFWPVGVVLCILFWGGRERRRLLPFFAIGYAIVILAQGLLDWVTWGSFLHSVIANVQKNIFEGVANMNGVSPWYFYVEQTAKNFGSIRTLLIGSSTVLAWMWIRPKMSLYSRLVVVPSLIFILIHMAIGHKELRFLLPIFPALFYFIALSWNAVFEKDSITERLRAGWVGLAMVLMIPFVWSDIYTPEHYARVDTSNLAVAVYEDGGLKSAPQNCLLLVDEYWHWTRGEMIQAQPVKFETVTAGSIHQKFLNECAYAIVSGWATQKFEQRAGLSWRRLRSDHWGHILYKRVGEKALSVSDPNSVAL